MRERSRPGRVHTRDPVDTPVNPAFDAILNRRSQDEKWPRRAAFFSVLSVFAAGIYYIFFFEATHPAGGGVAVDEGAGGSVWQHRVNNTADRDARGKAVGLPAFPLDASRYLGTEEPGAEAVEAAGNGVRDHRDDLSDSFWARRAARYLADVSDYVCGGASESEAQGDDAASSAGVETGANFAEDECTAWLDAGMLVHYTSKAKTRVREPTLLLAAGIRSEYNHHYLATFTNAGSDASFPSRDGCAVVVADTSAAAAPEPPDAGWAIACNANDLVVRVLAYQPFNATHYHLPWPAGHRRCFQCPTDDLFLPIALTQPVVPCDTQGPLRHATSHKRLVSSMSYCVNHTKAYLDAWMGRPDWLAYYMGHRFSHARLTESVHDGLWHIFKWCLIVAVSLLALFLCLVGAGYLQML